MGGVANSASFGCGGHWCFLSGIVVRTLQEGTCCLKKRGDFTEIREECRSETSKGGAGIETFNELPIVCREIQGFRIIIINDDCLAKV